MRYSCFSAETGMYRYFEDSQTQPINGDLPVPQFGTKTRLGVPSIAAARPLPRGARPTGTGWAARGMIVKCPGSGGGAALGLLGLEQESPYLNALVLILISGLLVKGAMMLERKMEK